MWVDKSCPIGAEQQDSWGQIKTVSVKDHEAVLAFSFILVPTLRLVYAFYSFFLMQKTTALAE